MYLEYHITSDTLYSLVFASLYPLFYFKNTQGDFQELKQHKMHNKSFTVIRITREFASKADPLQMQGK